MSIDEEDTPEPASPACFLHEVDPAWSGLEGAPCPFCRIAAGADPAHVVYADDAVVAFVDPTPVREGQIRIIPRTHYACFDDMPPGLAARVLHLGQRVAKAQKTIYGIARAGFVFSGSEVGHAHAHVMPLHGRTDAPPERSSDEVDVTLAGPKASEPEMARVADAMKAALAGT